MNEAERGTPQSRRTFLKNAAIASVSVTLTGVAAAALREGQTEEYVWQLDPNTCIQCGRCETECVIRESAVKCVHNMDLCGYCDLCFGYFQPGTTNRNSAVENQLCPTGAIERRHIEGPYFEYEIDESLCIACGKCVKGCTNFGNGSLFLQVRHDRCLNCNDCAIARNCPSNAFRRVPISRPYLLKRADGTLGAPDAD